MKPLTRLLPILTLAVTILSPAAATAWDYYQDGYYYNVLNGTATITDYDGPGGDINIPDTLGGNTVTIIGAFAFNRSTSLTSVTIPSSVTTLMIGAFQRCWDLISVTIPDSVTTIGDEAFLGCSSLTSVTISDSVTTIGIWAFFGCLSLTAIDVDFNNPNYSSLDGVLFDKDQTTLHQCPAGKSGSFTIPDSVTTIGFEAFGSCLALTNVTIPDSVTRIGGWAFIECISLVSVTIGNSVTYIGNGAFSWCDSLASVTIGNSVITIDDRAFEGSSSLVNVYFCGEPPDHGSSVFDSASATIYYLPAHATQWQEHATYADLPTVLWNPTFTDASMDAGEFSGTVVGTADIPVGFEVSTNLHRSLWQRLETTTLTDGQRTFTDLDAADHPTRFYRIIGP